MARIELEAQAIQHVVEAVAIEVGDQRLAIGIVGVLIVEEVGQRPVEVRVVRARERFPCTCDPIVRPIERERITIKRFVGEDLCALLVSRFFSANSARLSGLGGQRFCILDSQNRSFARGGNVR